MKIKMKTMHLLATALAYALTAGIAVAQDVTKMSMPPPNRGAGHRRRRLHLWPTAGDELRDHE